MCSGTLGQVLYPLIEGDLDAEADEATPHKKRRSEAVLLTGVAAFAATCLAGTFLALGVAVGQRTANIKKAVQGSGGAGGEHPGGGGDLGGGGGGGGDRRGEAGESPLATPHCHRGLLHDEANWSRLGVVTR